MFCTPPHTVFQTEYTPACNEDSNPEQILHMPRKLSREANQWEGYLRICRNVLPQRLETREGTFLPASRGEEMRKTSVRGAAHRDREDVSPREQVQIAGASD